jgi:bla regulator protein blaR1
LLAERFNLLVHSEMRELPIYELVLARTNGKLGPQLHKSDVDCTAFRASQRSGGPPSPPLTASSPPPMCGLFGGFGRMAGNSMSIDQLAGLLSRMVDRTVVNETGLAGNYDFDLTFTPEQPAPPPGSPLLPPGFDPIGPSIYTAIQEQLGLKLNSKKGPVNVIVIDRVEHPTPN